MATLTVIWWRDIPAQVIARDGRRSSKTVLHPRFQVAIDKAASRAGKRAYNDYIEEWRKVARGCGDDLEAEVNAESERLEAEYDKHRLAELIQSGGVAGGPALAPAHDETPKGARDGAPDPAAGAAATAGDAGGPDA
jgi:Virulence factor